MFEISKAPNSPHAKPQDKAVVDRDRDAWLQIERAIAMQPASVYRLIWKGRLIPFSAALEKRRDLQTGAIYAVHVIGNFGETIFSSAPRYQFKDNDERSQALRLAAEALIAFGALYDGNQYDDGIFRVEVEGRTYKRSDF